MRVRIFGSFVGIVSCLAVAFYSVVDAQAFVIPTVSYNGEVWPGLESYTIHLRSDSSPIVAFEDIYIDGDVHQVNACFGSTVLPSVFLDDGLPPEHWPYDTHLLLLESQIMVQMMPIDETNWRENIFGFPPDPPYSFSLGMFGGGRMAMTPSSWSNNLDFLQVVLPAGMSTFFHCMIGDYDGWMFPIDMQIGMMPSGITVDPSQVDFGPNRVGTTASAYVYAQLTYGEETDGWYSASPSPFGPSSGWCWLSPDYQSGLTYTFSPTSRGTFDGTGEVGAIGYDPAFVALSGTGVGPVFGAEQSPGSTIEFDPVPPDSFFDVFFDLSNVTTD
ncbi:MAG: hypothetical protein JW719_05130, partial [Pirellulales bacterium]|nr:hypothetical protein [Pirellulales bacterium]